VDIFVLGELKEGQAPKARSCNFQRQEAPHD